MVVDSDSLRHASGFRRRVQQQGYTCSHCGKVFVQEKAFMNHKCKEKKRAEEMKTIIGQVAYGFYVDWMKMQKFKAPPVDTFISSRYYQSFFKFSSMAANINIDKPNLYISLMVRRDIPPVMWHRDQCYSIYLEFMDKEADPIELVASSLDKLEKISIAENVKLSEIFIHLGFKRILELIRLRNLSPWLLLCSSQFKSFLNELDDHDLKLIAGIINIGFWTDNFEKKPDIRNIINPIVADFGL